MTTLHLSPATAVCHRRVLCMHLQSFAVTPCTSCTSLLIVQASSSKTGVQWQHVMLAIVDSNPFLSDSSKQVQLQCHGPLRSITMCIKIAAVSCTAAHGAAAEWACDRLQLALTLWQVAMACATEFVLPSKTASCCLTGHSGGGAAGVGRPHDGAHGGPGAAR